MNIRTVKYEQLSGDEIGAWSAIQRDHAAYRSPFFRPEFTQQVALVRPDVEVAVLEESGSAVGFFPFQRSRFNAGRPVCGGLSEFHGLIAPEQVECDPCVLLRACQLNSWRFDHLVATHPSFQKFVWDNADSPYIDLTSGFDNYIASRPNGASLLSECRQKERKLKREYGSTHFESHVFDPNALASCIVWKGAHARRTGRVDILKNEWIVKLFNNILAYQSAYFGSMMSVYYVGDRVASVIFGMRSADVFHAWMTSYDVALGKCSPGMLHWIELLKAAESIGIRCIIFGKGEEEHKRRLMSGADRVGNGCVELRPAVSAARRAWRQAAVSIKESPLRRPAQAPAKIVNRIATWLMFR